MALERRTSTDHRATLAKLERLQAAIETTRRKRAGTAGELARYVEQARDELAVAVTHVDARAAARDTRVPAEAPAVVTLPPLAAQEASRATGRRWPWLFALAVVTATAIVGITGWPSSRPGRSEPAPPSPRESTPPRQASGTAGAPPTAAAPEAPAAPDVPLRITLVASRPVWMRVVADGRRQLERELAPGEALTFTATRGILLRTGDAGGVRLTVNGVDDGVLGGNYAVVTRAIDAPPPASAR